MEYIYEGLLNESAFLFKKHVLEKGRAQSFCCEKEASCFIYVQAGRFCFFTAEGAIVAEAGQLIYFPPEVRPAFKTETKRAEVCELAFRYTPNVFKGQYSLQILWVDETLLQTLKDLPYEQRFGCAFVWKAYRFLAEAFTRMQPSYTVYSQTTQQALNYIRKCNGCCSVLEIAQACNISKSALNQIFKKETGQTPFEYKQNLRLEWAKQLLQTTELSVQEVALRIGFQSTEYFRKVFKKHFSVFPRKNL